MSNPSKKLKINRLQKKKKCSEYGMATQKSYNIFAGKPPCKLDVSPWLSVWAIATEKDAKI